MAIMIDFQKVREDNRVVEYQFGTESLDRRMVIDKESGEGRPVAGTAQDGYLSRVLWQILKEVETRHTWPEKGTYRA